MELLVVVLIAGAAVAAVLIPLMRGGPAHDRALDEPADGEARQRRSREEIEAEIRRYRAALREGTVCRRCGRANPRGSRFCSECGRKLPAGRRARVDPKAIA